MEVILVLLALMLGPALLKAIFGGAKSSASGGVRSSVSESPFKVHVRRSKEDAGGESVDVFRVALSGSILAPYNGYKYRFRLHIFDGSGDATKPVFCGVEELQEPDGVAFRFQTSELELPYEANQLSGEVPLIAIPCDLLVFPKKGMRNVRFVVYVVSASNPPQFSFGVASTVNWPSVLAAAQETLTYTNSAPGYEDQKQLAEQFEEQCVRLAMYVCAVDGSLVPAEGEVIKQWLKRRLESRADDDEQRLKDKKRYNNYVEKAFNDVKVGAIDLERTCAALRESGSTAGLYDVLKLCMNVAAADEKAEKNELDVVNRIGQLLSLNVERLRSMRDKIVPVSMHVDKADTLSLLGIDATSSKEQIRKRLNEEYKKWNARVTHPEEKVRKQAEEMVRLIGEARREHIG